MNIQKHGTSIANSGPRSMKRQTGATLMETLIALALSLVVTTAMVVLMANSLGTATRVIHMSQLTDELRNAMSMMTRDVRRANYSANSIFCYGYSKCGFAGGNALQAGDIQIANGGSCFTYTLDRSFNGDATDDAVGAFRRVTPGGVGVIEMWTGGAGTSPNCGSAAGAANWIELTDPRIVNITAFQVNDVGSVVKEIAESKTSTFDSRQREIELTLQGQLVIEEARGSTMVFREVGDVIYVRNDYVLPTI
jgi:type II secretory pathway pseudopilin PulG